MYASLRWVEKLVSNVRQWKLAEQSACNQVNGQENEKLSKNRQTADSNR